MPEFISWNIRYRKYWWEWINSEAPDPEEAEDFPGKHASEGYKRLWRNLERDQSNFHRASLIKIGLDLLVPTGVGAAAMGLAIKATCFWC
jgi:hypothetical protein